jgi:tetratricopeptide (TPR) repeat protein
MPPEYGFPSRLESIAVLRSASERNPADGRAPYYLGNLLYDRRPLHAIREWERARSVDDGLSTLHRNLAFAYFQVENDAAKAVASMEEAIARDSTDPRLFYELDMLSAAAGVPPERRLELLRLNHDVLVDHGDALSREVVLLAQLGFYDDAIEYMQTHHFRRWEGVGNIHTTYVDAHLLRGLEHVRAGRYEAALSDFEAALEYPKNLEVARPYSGGRSVEVYYLTGLAHEAAGDLETARELFRRSADGLRPPAPSTLDYYQGMAAAKLGRSGQANQLFDRLISHGRERLRALQDGSAVEFFAKFGTVRSLTEQSASAFYLQGLGYLGKGRSGDARAAFSRALSLNPNHLWAAAHLVDLR